ncbi:TetR/AcrR family transcriptional regulator [Amycolatopsis alkalitolerans]|uniref:TetR/AcrR family transcriptional regulator n=1 Tax=Amycolatopsis alkalitolerans TaxID=2547244 RepID=A0A5C4LW71_9PSEU|nr:TetR/AcrR family transcriptional regulator [Amycolatopsis alkalitolerans]TNC23681.1 TetR/AcrR family transcriptional regulator [Amycolatopsis alkalitolerans]
MKIERQARRPYRMSSRAQAAEKTAERIVDAAVDLFWQHPADDISLDEVARQAGVTVQTVIRRFGGKYGLLAAAAERETERVSRQRGEAPVGDISGAVRNLLDHYEELGLPVLRLLAQEDRSAALRELADRGRAVHAQWCERVFAAALAGLGGTERARRLAQLVAVTDVVVWKLLRHERGLSRRQTELALVELLQPLTGDA